MTSLIGASIITCAILYGVLAAILVFVCIVLEVPVFIAFLICIAVILLQYFLSPWITDLIQRWLYKTDFNTPMPAYLESFIQQVCTENNMKYPRMGFINDGAPNAFTYGHTKNDARIVLTRGIFDLLTEDEVKAVVAHELGHAVHYDMLLMTMVQLVPMVLYGIYDVLIHASKESSSDKSDYTAVVAIVAYILYLATQYLILWLSRVREYYADEFSANTTRNPNALASALVNIGFGLSTREKSKETLGSVTAESTLGIFDTKSSKSMAVTCYKNGQIVKDNIKNAMKWELWNVWAKFYELGSTHPLTSKRLKRLGELAKSQGQQPFVDFDLERPESYVDDFFRELFISIMPTLGFIACLIVALIQAVAESEQALMWVGIACVVAMVLSCLKYLYTHPRREYHEANTAGLLGEVKVSMIKSIPAELKGRIIGKGDPGCIFDENFVLQDNTGILFLDYNQPLWIINKVFALFKSHQYIDQYVTVKGWYRRNMVPFFELYSMEINGETKKCYNYIFGWIWRIVLLVLAVALTVACVVML
ncbi:MAG: M48 family metalloprotease [Coriobacteriales bacterium]|nr:M48 family metalloprotease [Coriobacteriales bacterium]